MGLPVPSMDAVVRNDQPRVDDPLGRAYEIAAAAQARDAIGSANNPLLVNVRTAAWLGEQEFPPLRWAVPGIVPEGASLLVGGPKVGKSWLALGVALGVASGGVVLGKLEVEQRPVLLLALEDGDRRMQQRSRLLMDGQPLPEWFRYVTTVEPGQHIATIEAWLSLVPENYPPPLVVVDTLGKMMAGSPPGDRNESSYERDYRMAGSLKSLTGQRDGLSLVALHHDRKAYSEDFVHMVSGTNGIAGAFDTILLLTRKRLNQRGELKVTGRDVPEQEYALTSNGGPWTLNGESLADAAREASESREVERLGERSTEILRYVNSQPAGVRPKEVAFALRLDGSTAQKYLSRLADEGRVRKESRGLYLPVVSVDSVDLAYPKPTDTTETTQAGPKDFDSRPLVCDVCGSAEAIRFAHPWWVVRCKEHNPVIGDSR